MNVQELIAELQKLPPELDVMLWDDDADDWLPVAQALYEDGTSHIALLTEAVTVFPVHPFGACGGTCNLCGDQPGQCATCGHVPTDEWMSTNDGKGGGATLPCPRCGTANLGRGELAKPETAA